MPDIAAGVAAAILIHDPMDRHFDFMVAIHTSANIVQHYAKRELKLISILFMKWQRKKYKNGVWSE